MLDTEKIPAKTILNISTLTVHFLVKENKEGILEILKDYFINKFASTENSQDLKHVSEFFFNWYFYLN